MTISRAYEWQESAGTNLPFFFNLIPGINLIPAVIWYVKSVIFKPESINLKMISALYL